MAADLPKSRGLTDEALRSNHSRRAGSGDEGLHHGRPRTGALCALDHPLHSRTSRKAHADRQIPLGCHRVALRRTRLHRRRFAPHRQPRQRRPELAAALCEAKTYPRFMGRGPRNQKFRPIPAERWAGWERQEDSSMPAYTPYMTQSTLAAQTPESQYLNIEHALLERLNNKFALDIRCGCRV